MIAKSQMRLSIALATYNGARFLAPQLASFAAQERLPDELVISDDGSTDETVAIAEGFAREQRFPVRVLRHPTRLGYAANFGNALEHCTGEIALFADQDDVWFPDKLAVVEDHFRHFPRTLALVHDAILGDESANPTEISLFAQLERVGMRAPLHKGAGACSALNLAMRPLLLPIPISPPTATHSSHDVWAHRIAIALGAQHVLRRPLQIWRRHSTNVSQTIASSRGRSTQWKRIPLALRSDPRRAARRDCFLLETLMARISTERDVVARLTDGRPPISAILNTLEREHAATKGRLALYDHPRLVRVLPAVSFYRGGGYAYFSGWRSLIRDLVSPTWNS